MGENFSEKEPIYLQIARRIGDGILEGLWKEGERIPSVREMAVAMEVNPLTVLRAYEWLEARGIIESKRGRGYFVKQGGKENWRKYRMEQFIKEDLPEFEKTLKLLGIDSTKIIEQIKTEILKSHSNEES
ncbi:MAG: GntR family transcriptional regulator [Chlorobi bacterium]|nr:GntR family transcriptional regulator [Chlorobiota bacterium]